MIQIKHIFVINVLSMQHINSGILSNYLKVNYNYNKIIIIIMKINIYKLYK